MRNIAKNSLEKVGGMPLELSKSPDFVGKAIVALLTDTGERYLSTWLFE